MPSACGPRARPGSARTGRAAVKKRILILGGTGFLGPKTIDAALARGHTVTIFNRGKREKYLPLEHPVEHLYGNRDPLLPADDLEPFAATHVRQAVVCAGDRVELRGPLRALPDGGARGPAYRSAPNERLTPIGVPRVRVVA